MKKIISLILCLPLLFTIVAAVPQTVEIEGLQDQMDALWMGSYFTTEQLGEMAQRIEEESIAAEIAAFWSIPWDQRQMIEWRNIKYLDDPEAELAYRLSQGSPLVLAEGVRITFLNTIKFQYAYTYAHNGNFEYLFSDEYYWAVSPEKFAGISSAFTPNFERIRTWTYENELPIGFNEEQRGFLKNTDAIAEMLRGAGVTKVYDAKVFVAGMPTCLYLCCDNGSYLIRLSEYGQYNLYPEFEKYSLYTVRESTQIMADVAENYDGGWLFGLGVAQNATAKKPIFEAEAEALQAAGLLQGNEKGLDLYKPLSRIEAITLLVRALGLEDESTAPQSRFADIPDGSWGVKYANIAAEQGITLGTGNGNFAPNALVTDDQFATFLLRAVDAPEFDWETAIQALIDQGILTAEEAKTMDLFTRGDMAKIIYEAREKGLLQ